MLLSIITILSCQETYVSGIESRKQPLQQSALCSAYLLAAQLLAQAVCLTVSFTVLKETGPKKHNGARYKHPENCQMCFGGFLHRSLQPWPWACRAAEKGLISQETDSFSQWEPLLAMLMLIHSPLMEMGERRMAPLFSLFSEIRSSSDNITEGGAATLRCYS